MLNNLPNSLKNFYWLLGGLGIIMFATIGFLKFQSDKAIEKKNQEIMAGIDYQPAVLLDWEVKEQVSPMSYAGENLNLVEIKVYTTEETNLRISAEVPGITKKAVEELNDFEGTQIVRVGPEITKEGFQQLETKAQDATVKFKVTQLREGEETGDVLLEQEEPVKFLALNDVIWADGVKYMVRFVNKDDPAIAEIARKAADHMPELGGESTAMLGNLGDKEERIRQLKAIFLAISKDTEIRYIAAMVSYESPDIQRVKTPAEVVETKSGLCVELALLYAAVLEHVSLRPVIIVVPGHAWVGIETTAGNNEYYFIESTMLENTPEEALEIGQKEWEMYSETGDYELINVIEMRSEGLMPIVY